MEKDQIPEDILELLHLVINIEEAKLKRELEIARVARSYLKRANSNALTFDISILSMWSNEGEKSLENFRFTGDIETAISNAALEFKQLVKRSDIQANWLIQVVFKRRKHAEILLRVPNKYWKKYTDAVSVPT